MTMPRYRKKPVVIDAYQIGEDGWPDWAWDKVNTNEIVLRNLSAANQSGHIEINTLEGVMIGNFGDWLIRGIAGEVYPCKPDIFADTYESA